MTSTRISPRLRYLGAWLLAGMYNFSRDVFSAPLLPLAMFNFAHFAVWAALGLLAMPLMRRYPLRRDLRPWLFHLAASAVFAQLDVTLGHLIFMAFTGQGQGLGLPEVARIAFVSCFHLAVLTYWCFLGVVQALDTQQLVRLREVQLAEHRTALVQAQLQNLRSQLQPHFLFNTLNVIASLMHYDVPAADRMLNRLGDLLRLSLRDTDKRLVRLEQEVALVEAYLDIERIRFERRLDVCWAIPAELRGSSIPPFILQPLVENAIKYGIAPRTAGGSVTIRAYAEADALLIEVEDDAPEGQARQPGFGIGLSNTRSRLEALYGAGKWLELVRAGAGTIARIRLPLPVAAA
jgi:two-component system LytT family sensor kinase